MSVAWLGLNHVSWNFARSSRVSFETLASVPEPVSGLPYACCGPYSKPGNTRNAMGTGVTFSR
jgi:hypothetical protein